MAFNSTTRILIVEDDLLVALMMEAIVEDLGYWVVGPSTDFDGALEAALSGDLDFALLDFDLGGGKDSRPIAEVLARRGIPFAFTTGVDPAVLRQTLNQVKVISKPVAECELLDLLP